MGLRINTNVQAMAAQRATGLNFQNVQKSQEKLSSGSRIVRSADDAAGLAISTNMNADIRSMRQAARNAGDGVSLIQTAEGGMSEIGNILIRMRELSIQGASDTIGDRERSFIDKEVFQLREEIERIAVSTEFNGKKLLVGNQEQVEVQVGVRNVPTEDRIAIDLAKMSSNLETLGIRDLSVATKEASQENLNKLDESIKMLSQSRSELGAYQNRLDATIRNLQVYDENLSAAKSRIADADVAEVATALTKDNILSSSSVAVLGQANHNSKLALSLLG